MVKPIVLAKHLPYWSTTDNKTVRLYLGHVVDQLRKLPAASVQCVVTSPPYWGLRDYGTGEWEGGDPECSHTPPDEWLREQTEASTTLRSGATNGTQKSAAIKRWYNTDGSCRNCGARRTDQQLGSEDRPDCSIAGSAKCEQCFVCHMVQVFHEVYRVLRPDGLLFLNLGDTYASGGGHTSQGASSQRRGRANVGAQNAVGQSNTSGLPGGNLVGVPWRVALALQADGWILRQDVVWRKPSPMPESVTNRCTKSQEYIFMFSKQQDYYADMEAVKEKAIRAGDIPGGDYNNREDKPSQVFGKRVMADGSLVNSHPVPEQRNKHNVWSINEETALYQWLAANAPELLGQFLLGAANKGSVWTFSGQGYKGAHFATFPEELPRLCLKIGTSEVGCCPKCSAPWRRLMQEQVLTRSRPNEYVKRTGEEGTGNSCANTVAGVESRTLGWIPTCHCHGLGLINNPPRPPVPKNNKPPSSKQIIGSGTSCVVALDMKLHSIGIDLSKDYLDRNAIPRIEGVLLSRPAWNHLVPKRKPST